MSMSPSSMPSPRRADVEAGHFGPCPWCGLPVVWLASTRTGKVAPIEVTPSAARDRSATISVDLRAGTYTQWGPTEAQQQRDAGHTLYLGHVERCPESKAWRGAHGLSGGWVP